MVNAAAPDGSSVSKTEVYGFVGWITSVVAFVLYLLWAYVPDRILWCHGVTYYPSKYWAVAFPTWVCVTVVAVYWIYESLNMTSVRPKERQTPCELNGQLIDPAACQYFNSDGSRNILPLRVIPPELVNLILQERLHPREAELLHKQRLKERAVVTE